MNTNILKTHPSRRETILYKTGMCGFKAFLKPSVLKKDIDIKPKKKSVNFGAKIGFRNYNFCICILAFFDQSAISLNFYEV